MTRLVSYALLWLVLLWSPALALDLRIGPRGTATTIQTECIVTFATLPASPTVGDICSVTDAPNTTTCTSGGGSTAATCLWDGAAWVPLITSPGTVTIAARPPDAGDACALNDRWLDTSTDPPTWWLPVSCTTDAEEWEPTTGPGVDQPTPTLDAVKTAGRRITSAVSLETASILDGIARYEHPGLGTVHQCVDTDNTAVSCHKVFGLATGEEFNIVGPSPTYTNLFKMTSAGTATVGGSAIITQSTLTSGRPGMACVEVVDAAASMDNVMFNFIAPTAITVTAVACKVLSGTVVQAPTFTLEDDDGNAMTITGTNPTCAAVGTESTWAAVTAGGGLIAGEGVRFDITNTPDANDTYSLCFIFSIP